MQQHLSYANGHPTQHNDDVHNKGLTEFLDCWFENVEHVSFHE